MQVYPRLCGFGFIQLRSANIALTDCPFSRRLPMFAAFAVAVVFVGEVILEVILDFLRAGISDERCPKFGWCKRFAPSTLYA